MKYENIQKPHSGEMHRYIFYCWENSTALFFHTFKKIKKEEQKTNFPFYLFKG